MGTQGLSETISQIVVKNQPNADVDVVNPTSLQMIGKGRQGAIFRYSKNKCVKVFGNKRDCEREFYALSLGQHTNLFPRVYEKGANYILMQYVTGIDLREYLQSQPLTPALSLKLVDMLVTFKEIGFERIDHHKRQIYLQPDGSLKVIDVGRTVWRNRVYPYPRKLLNSLGKEHRKVFLSHVKEAAPELYEEWRQYMQLEKLARQAFQTLRMSPSEGERKAIRTLSRRLLTQSDAAQQQQIESLIYKVFKEQHWKKTENAARSSGVVRKRS